MRMRACPCCGSLVAQLGDLTVNLEQNRVYRGGRSVHVYPRVAEFLTAIIQTYPRTTTDEDLRKALWGNTPEAVERSEKTIQMYASFTRKFCAELGVNLKRVYGLGYHLELADIESEEGVPMI